MYIDYIPINSCNIVTMPLNFLCTSVAASLDVRLLTLELKSVQNRWFELGIRLDVQYSVLKGIKNEHSGTTDDSHAAVLAPVQSILLLEYHHWGTQRDWWKCTSWNPSINLWVYRPEPRISWQVIMKLTFAMHSYTWWWYIWYLVADDCSSVRRSSVLSVGDKKPSGLLKLIPGMSTA